MIEGVAQVGVWGSAKYAVRVQLDPDAAGERNIGVSQVANGDPQQQRDAARRACCTARTRRSRSRRPGR